MRLSLSEGVSFLKKYPPFFCIISAKFFSIMSGRMLFTIMGWQIYKITNDPLSIGLIGLFEVLPSFLIALYAGHIIDSTCRKKIVTTVISINIFLAILLTLFSLKYHGGIIAYIFYSYAFCIGFLRSFWGSSLSSMIPNIIPKGSIPKSAPFNTGSFLTGSIIGHALGGFLIAHTSISQSLSIGIILFGIALFFILKIPKQDINPPSKASAWKNIVEGLNYVFSNKIILSALLLDLFAVLFGGVVALLPIYATDVLFISASKFGWLNASMDIGAIIGIGSISLFPIAKNQGKKMIISVGLFGVFIVIFALSTNFWLSGLALIFCGFFDSISMIVRSIILQSFVPDNIRGRVMSVNSLFVSSSNELGQFESGLTQN